MRGKAFTDGEWKLKYRITSLTGSPSAVYLIAWLGDAEELILPDRFDGAALTQIQSGAFAGRTALKSITIPEGVTVIAEDAFSNCSDGLVIRSGWNAYAKDWAEEHQVTWAHDRHTPEVIPAVAATCLEDGLTE